MLCYVTGTVIFTQVLSLSLSLSLYIQVFSTRLDAPTPVAAPEKLFKDQLAESSRTPPRAVISVADSGNVSETTGGGDATAYVSPVGAVESQQQSYCVHVRVSLSFPVYVTVLCDRYPSPCLTLCWPVEHVRTPKSYNNN